MSAYYSTVDEVISYTGVAPQTLGLNTHSELETLLEIWLVQIKDLIDRDRNRNYTKEGDVPPGIDNIARRMAAHLVRSAERQRSNSVVDIDGNQLQVDDVSVFTDEIMKDLRRYPAKPRLSMSLLPGNDNGSA